ncbi:MAG: pyridoxamine 5'-phosphate oxidase family protein [Alphaproteobacteria bacterium]
MSSELVTGTPAGANFHSGELVAQERWGKAGAWNRESADMLLWKDVPGEYHQRLQGAPFFFLATSDADGRSDCAFKGGGPGLVRMLSGTRLAFPDYAGNNAFTSLGNILSNPLVSLLFIDFTDGARLRINGRADIHDDGEAKKLFPDASRVVVVDIEFVMPLCPSHVPRLAPVQA